MNEQSSSRFRRILDGVLGGIVAVLCFAAVLVLIDGWQKHKFTGGMGATFHGIALAYAFVFGLLPVFAMGAMTGVVIADRTRIAAKRAGCAIAACSVLVITGVVILSLL